MPVRKHPERKLPVREEEVPLHATVTGKNEPTPKKWNDLIEFALTALRREKGKHDEDAA